MMFLVLTYIQKTLVILQSQKKSFLYTNMHLSSYDYYYYYYYYYYHLTLINRYGPFKARDFVSVVNFQKLPNGAFLVRVYR